MKSEMVISYFSSNRIDLHTMCDAGYAGIIISICKERS